MRKLLVLLALLLLLAACPAPQVASPLESNEAVTLARLTSSVTVLHDNVRRVTCWIYQGNYTGAGISCLPDAEVY